MCSGYLAPVFKELRPYGVGVKVQEVGRDTRVVVSRITSRSRLGQKKVQIEKTHGGADACLERGLVERGIWSGTGPTAAVTLAALNSDEKTRKIIETYDTLKVNGCDVNPRILAKALKDGEPLKLPEGLKTPAEKREAKRKKEQARALIRQRDAEEKAKIEAEREEDRRRREFVDAELSGKANAQRAEIEKHAYEAASEEKKKYYDGSKRYPRIFKDAQYRLLYDYLLEPKGVSEPAC